MKVKAVIVFLSAVLICAVADVSGASVVPDSLQGLDVSRLEHIDDSVADEIRGEAWSPNGFPRGQCTWYADGRWKERHGFKLKFSISSGRDAWKWYDIVTNVGKGTAYYTHDYAGEIMVLNRWSGNNYGHNSFVESSVADSTGGRKWNVTHVNWNKNDPSSRSIEGVRVTKKTFYRVNYNTVSTGGTARYPLRGFLYKK